MCDNNNPVFCYLHLSSEFSNFPVGIEQRKEIRPMNKIGRKYLLSSLDEISVGPLMVTGS